MTQSQLIDQLEAYIALGDSMSIDLYPALDLKRDPESTAVGAAALLYRNDDETWAGFKNNDLISRNPRLKFANLAEDGATTWPLMHDEYLRLLQPFSNQKVLITLTLGGNDALQLLRMDVGDPSRIMTECAAILDRYKRVVAKLEAHFSDATIILATIYDPSDGTGLIPTYPAFSDKLPFLGYLNHEIKLIAEEKSWLLADAHSHFMGHGLSAPADQRWYWNPSPIEPSALGASELRRLWLKTLGLN